MRMKQKMQKLNSDDVISISKSISCECGAVNCSKILILTKYPKKKIKIRVWDKKNIISVVISKKKLMEVLKKVK